MDRRPSILVVGDAAVPTGYARVLRSILEPLADRYALTHLATRYDGSAHTYPWTLLPAADFGDPYGLTGFAEAVDRVRPDIVFLLYDLAYQARYLERLRASAWRPAVVIYSPIESGPLEPEILDGLAGTSRYVVFSRYARDLVLDSLASPHRASRPAFPADVDVIPHGVDADMFRPLPGGRAAARRALGLAGADLDDAFIVLNGNRNLVKKRLDVTIEAFARFAADKPASVRLLLHTDIAGGAFNVMALSRRHGITNRLILTSDDGTPDLSNERLNQVYNACDVGVNTSVSEGCGLVSFEHAATRRAQIVPGSPCLRDLWGDAAVIVEPALVMTNPDLLTLSYPVSSDAVAQALERLYSDGRERERMADRAYRHATRPALSWSAISRGWDKLFAEVLDARRDAGRS